MRQETRALEQTFNTLTTDIQVSKAAERITAAKLRESESTLEQFRIQNGEVINELDVSKIKIAQYEHAGSIIESMNLPISSDKKRPNSEIINDPVAMLEYQWHIDRERFGMEIEVFKSQIVKLDVENSKLKAEIKERIKTMHDSSAWALMYR